MQNICIETKNKINLHNSKNWLKYDQCLEDVNLANYTIIKNRKLNLTQQISSSKLDNINMPNNKCGKRKQIRDKKIIGIQLIFSLFY